jgi:hypothetical protein
MQPGNSRSRKIANMAVATIVVLFGIAAFRRRRNAVPENVVSQPGLREAPEGRPAMSAWRKLGLRTIILVLGALISAFGAVLGYSGLRAASPPPPTVSTIGFTTTSPGVTDGLFADMRITVTGCQNPVDVSLLIRIGAGAWATGYAPKNVVSKVALVVTGPISDLHAQTGSLYQARNGLVSDNVPPGPYASAAEAPSDPQMFRYRDSRIRRGASSYELSYGTVRDWAQTHIGLYYSFKAPWLVPRTGGSLLDYEASSCYLSLPSITGADVQRADVDAVKSTGQPLEPGNVTSPTIADGAILVLSKQALFDAADSYPPPTESRPEGDLWTCQSSGIPSLSAEEASIRVFTPGLVQVSPSGIPFWEATSGPEASIGDDPIAGYDSSAPPDCTAAVALESGASTSASGFSLVIAGALLGLGLTVIFEELVRIIRRRMEGSEIDS